MFNLERDEANALLGCVGVLIWLAAIPLSYVLNGWALSVLWGWFIVQTFDTPILSIPAAIGVAMIASYLTKDSSLDDDAKSRKSTTERFIHALIVSVFHPLLAVGVGWVVLQFM